MRRTNPGGGDHKVGKDNVKQTLKEMKRDADKRARSNDREESEQGSADWHIADGALRAWNRK